MRFIGFALALWAFSSCSLVATHASAQADSPALQIAPEFSIMGGSEPSALSDSERRVALRRARWLLAVGVGLTAGAAIAVGGLQRRSLCNDDDEPLSVPGAVGGFVGAFGLSLTTVGAVKLMGIDVNYRRKHLRPKHVVGMVAGAIGFAALGVLTVTIPSISQWVDCVSS
jgi:hypothetical protein